MLTAYKLLNFTIMNLYAKNYDKASEYALIILNISHELYLTHSSFNTEIGQCSCINIEDDDNKVIYRLFYDQHLFEMQPLQVRVN
jgi:hypothetical protein